MLKTTRRVLKADEVVLADPFRLDLDSAAGPLGPGEEPPCASADPRVRVAQSYPEYAVIEVACPCGRTTYVRCEYAAARPSPVPQPAARA